MKKILLSFIFCVSPVLAGQGGGQFDMNQQATSLTVLLNENGGTTSKAVLKSGLAYTFTNITLTNSPIWTNGYGGSGLYFSGSAYTNGATNNSANWSFPTAGAPWTIKFIFFHTNPKINSHKYFAWIGQDAGGKVIAPEIDGNGKMFLANSGADPAPSALLVPATTWCMAAFTYKAGVSKTYLFYDGRLQKSGSFNVTYNLAMNSYETWQIGEYAAGGAGTNFLGTIDSMQLVKHAQTQESLEAEFAQLSKQYPFVGDE